MTPRSAAFALLIVSVSLGRAEDLAKAVVRARTQPIHPQVALPKWTDDGKVAAGYAFFRTHQATIGKILIGSSLVSSYAGRDTCPVVMETGKLAHSFGPRMMATGMMMSAILATPKDAADFAKTEYVRAVDLGKLHQDVADAVRKPLGWDSKVRVPMNGQSFGLVLYSFAWWPLEAMLATGEVDPKRDAAGIAGWLHLWSVLGHGMGVPDGLLPRDLPKARQTIALIKAAQFAKAGERPPEGIPVLLGGNVRLLAQFSKSKSVPEAAKTLADEIALSPGLAEALGLGAEPAARLAEYGALPPAK